jgi:hypothetical protein
MKVTSHCLQLRSKLIPTFEGLRKVGKTEWGLSYGTLEITHRGIFIPTVAYAAAGWADLCNEHDRRVLRDLHRQTLIGVTKSYRTVSYDALCVLCWSPPDRHSASA